MHTLLVLFVLGVSMWNGACYYFDIFAKRYVQVRAAQAPISATYTRTMSACIWRYVVMYGGSVGHLNTRYAVIDGCRVVLACESAASFKHIDTQSLKRCHV